MASPIGSKNGSVGGLYGPTRCGPVTGADTISTPSSDALGSCVPDSGIVDVDSNGNVGI